MTYQVAAGGGGGEGELERGQTNVISVASDLQPSDEPSPQQLLTGSLHERESRSYLECFFIRSLYSMSLSSNFAFGTFSLVEQSV